MHAKVNGIVSYLILSGRRSPLRSVDPELPEALSLLRALFPIILFLGILHLCLLLRAVFGSDNE
jgi:hypothetical protein